MKIPVKDRSNYLKGLLIIARKNNQLAETEKNIIRGIAEKLGFASDFYEEILRSLLANQYILDDHLRFSNLKIAQSFIADGLKLAYSDNKISNKEIDWLKNTAMINNLGEEWFENKHKMYKDASNLLTNSDFALYSII